MHFYWEAPYGVLFWQDGTFALAKRLGFDWVAFVGTGANDGLVQLWIGRLGWVFLAGCVVCLTAREQSRLQLAVLLAGSGLLMVLSYAKFVKAQRQLPMLVEHGGQFLMPVILVLALKLGVRHRATIITSIVAVIMTFASHGVYALGWGWPTPANYYGMTSVILNVEYETAKTILLVAGVLDFTVCIALLIPFARGWAALYAVIWGLLTALARPVAGMATGLNYWGADQFIHEAVVRAPHFVIPLYLLLLVCGVRKSGLDEGGL